MDATFFQAVANGDIQYFDDLELGRLQAVTREGEDGVLHIAARFGQDGLVRQLRDDRRLHQFDLLRPNKRGDTSLHCAATMGNVDIVNILCEVAIEKNQLVWFLRATNDNEETCLHEAVRYGRTDVVRLLVENDDVLVPDGAETKTPLVEALDRENVSPLYLAVTLNRVEIIRVLTERRRRHPASYIGPRAKTALHAAATVQNYELMRLLLDWRWRRGDNQPDELLGTELIRKADESGSTTLHYLASLMGTRTKNMVQLLLERDRERGGNAAYSVDSEGSMPIHIAAAHGRLDIIKVLLEECPDCVWSCDSFNRTILHIAVQKEKNDLVACICFALDVPNFLEKFILYPSLASTVASPSILRLLYWRSWNTFVSTPGGKINAKFRTILNARDKDGNTALHLAVLAGCHAGFLSLLSSPMVNLNIANREGYTPLDLAYIYNESKLQFKNGRAWILDSLEKAGACLGVQPFDDLIKRVRVEKDLEKNWEKIGETAGVLGVCAVLILNATFVMPFTVANYYYQHQSTDHATSSITLKLFISSNAMAFYSSTMAIYSCTYAGFAAVENKFRLFQLYMGIKLLYVASLAIITAFALGLILAFGTDIGAASLCLFSFIMFTGLYASILGPIWSIILHSIVLRSRGTLRYHSLFHRSVQDYRVSFVIIFTSLTYIFGISIIMVQNPVISGPKTDGTRIAPSPGPSIGHSNLHQ